MSKIIRICDFYVDRVVRSYDYIKTQRMFVYNKYLAGILGHVDRSPDHLDLHLDRLSFDMSL